jgi:hypothetical protein
MQNPIPEILTDQQYKQLTEREYINKTALRDYIVRRDYFNFLKDYPRYL